MTPRFTRDRRNTIRRQLLDWYEGAERDLPWRRTKDPYRIWLSESMLQQTRVETVIPYYDRFIERFPTLRALAVADEQDVLREWAGLGYYARGASPEARRGADAAGARGRCAARCGCTAQPCPELVATRAEPSAASPSTSLPPSSTQTSDA